MQQQRFTDCNILNSLKENNTLLALLKDGWQVWYVVTVYVFKRVTFELPTISLCSSMYSILILFCD